MEIAQKTKGIKIGFVRSGISRLGNFSAAVFTYKKSSLWISQNVCFWLYFLYIKNTVIWSGKQIVRTMLKKLNRVNFTIKSKSYI